MSARTLTRDVRQALIRAGYQPARAYSSGWAKDAAGNPSAGSSGIVPGFRVVPDDGAVLVSMHGARSLITMGYVGLVQLKHQRKKWYQTVVRHLNAAGFVAEITDGRTYKDGNLSVTMPVVRVTALTAAA